MDKNIMAQHLAQAEQHVAEGEQHIARQRQLLARLERTGHDTCRTHIADRDRLLNKLTKPD